MNTMKEFVKCDRMNNAFDFLLFSYFGIASAYNPKSDKILIKLIERAYRDAASHVLSVNKDVKDDKKQEAVGIIKAAIDDLKETESQFKDGMVCHGSYDKWHETLCDKLVNIYKDCCKEGYTFTYGVAQKWVNMTMKYVYIVYYMAASCKFLYDFGEEYGNIISKHRRSLHVPIDSYIYKAVKNDLGISTLDTSWSKISDYSIYIKYQNSIREHEYFDYTAENPCGYAPIDWEGNAWIEIAKN